MHSELLNLDRSVLETVKCNIKHFYAHRKCQTFVAEKFLALSSVCFYRLKFEFFLAKLSKLINF